ncbi:hypothetical protein BJ165DRAFT_647221 [Panaeolus papilionaceus]|nr:hypothetical protein BJ165DRAFT_647221 [Panaeolus papilionaceus]
MSGALHSTAFLRPMKMTLPITFYLAILSSLICSVNAQVTFRRRRPSIGRIIAGAVIGGVCGLLLLCFLCMLLRRRRLARNNPAVGGPTMMSKPLFGGPWGRQNRNHPTHNQAPMTQHQGNPYWNGNGQQGYENGAPPPQYGGSSPGNTHNNNQQFAPPPGPPPPAHMKGEDNGGNNFVGGFQQHM